MENSLERNHNNIQFKIALLNSCFEFILNKKNNLLNKDIYNSFLKHKKTYTIETISFISEYYDDSKTDKNSVSDLYSNYLISSNYINILNEYTEYIENNFSNLCNTQLKKIKKINISTHVSDIETDICECKGKMIMFQELSEYKCTSCGRLKYMIGSLLDISQSNNTSVIKSKYGSYDPGKHCRFWINRIQAKELFNISSSCIETIKKCLKRDNITNLKFLKCVQIRNYLKENKMSEYNDHVPYIRRLINNVFPPQLTYEESLELYNYFDQVNNIYDSIKDNNKTNTIYYPYIIYKILEAILSSGNRKYLILECIHLQSRETLIVNDKIWEKICKYIDITYIPTDKYLFNFD
jgi:hypothetical protein